MIKLNDADVTDVLDSFFIDYAIDDDADEESVRELMQQRSDMNKAVNEWYAKAEAFDRIAEEVKITEFEILEKELVSSDVGYRSLGKEIARFVTKEEEDRNE